MTIYDIQFLDLDHDMFLMESDIAFTDANEVVKQRLKIRLQFFLAEWFLDNTAGVPYTQIIFERGIPIATIYEIIRKEIVDTEGVGELKNLNLDFGGENSNLTISFEVNSGNISESLEIEI